MPSDGVRGGQTHLVRDEHADAQQQGVQQGLLQHRHRLLQS